ncbi:MAG: aminoacyl-tRNA hydrolase [Planctomycetota bacterium]
MKLVVGLGNPGTKYNGTRHNVGFDVIAELAKRYDVGRPKGKFNAELAEVFIGGEKTVLMCPLTFMNLSGRSVGDAVDFYKLPLEDLLIICDDLNLPVARLRIRPSGSAGGQNGLDDIIRRLGTKEFSRLRIGIDRPPSGRGTSGYVLGRFPEEDAARIQTSISRAADAVECWVKDGLQLAMSRFNPDPEEAAKRAEKKRLADLRRKEQLEKEKADAESQQADAEPKLETGTEPGQAEPDR